MRRGSNWSRRETRCSSSSAAGPLTRNTPTAPAARAVATAQIVNTRQWRAESTPEIQNRLAGVMHTVWSDNADFLDQFYGRRPPDTERGDPIECTKAYLAEVAAKTD